MEDSRPIGRDGPILELELLVGDDDRTFMPSSITAFGVASTGKTMTISWFLAHHSVNHAVFNCVAGYSQRLMMETILKQLLGGEARRCDNISEFLNHLRHDMEPGVRSVIVLQLADRLRDMDANLLQSFTRLQELTGLNICCIFETRLDWGKFRPTHDILTPVPVHFPQYTQDQLEDIVAISLPGDRPLSFKQGFAGLVLSVFQSVARCCKELIHISRVNYPEYCRPVLEGECGEDDVKKLWVNVEKPLRKCLSTVALREVSSKQYLAAQKEKEEKESKKDSKDETTDFRPLNTVNVNRITVELPYYSKFLLIAAYLASYNPQKSDKRFFVKQHGKQRKTVAMIKAKEKLNSQLTGPKPFPMDRMLAIFYNIVDDRVNPTANIYSQMTSLVHLQLLTGVGSDLLDQPKYKCNVNLDFIRNVCRTVQFDIYKYLYDYCS